jgi:FkbM family methyltransferase
MIFRNQIGRYLVRPYIRQELPGWGKLYEQFIGSYNSDDQWVGHQPCKVQGKLHGYVMELDISGWSNRATWALGRFYDLGTQLVVGALLNKGDLFVDIGANEGMISLLASRCVGTKGRIISFEPNPTPRLKFEKNVELNHINNIEIIPAGASSESGKLDLFVPAVNTGEGSFAISEHEEREGQIISCPIVVADDVLAGLNPALIKIDVEGFEPNVIEGLRSTISNTKPILVLEMVSTHIDRAGFTVATLCHRMNDLGYVGMRILIGGSLQKRLEFAPIDLNNWQDSDIIWIPVDKVKATMATLRGFSQNQVKSKCK